MAEEYFQALRKPSGIADGIEAGNTLAIQIATAEAEAISDLFDTGGEADQFFDDLETACPNEIEDLRQ